MLKTKLKNSLLSQIKVKLPADDCARISAYLASRMESLLEGPEAVPPWHTYDDLDEYRDREQFSGDLTRDITLDVYDDLSDFRYVIMNVSCNVPWMHHVTLIDAFMNQIHAVPGAIRPVFIRPNAVDLSEIVKHPGAEDDTAM